MTKKRKHAELEARRLRKLAAQGRIVGGIIIPEGSVPADPMQQAPNSSWSPPLYYVDQEFECIDCGKHEVWTAERQKWYYEVAKGSIYGRAVRCRSCRAEVRRRLADNTLGDPNRIRTIAGLFARLHEFLAPDLAKFGFQAQQKKPIWDRRTFRYWLDYQSADNY